MEEEQDILDEIATQSQQLDLHLQVKEIEKEKNAESNFPDTDTKSDDEVEIDKQDQHSLEKLDETRRRLIQDVIDEARENGTSLSPAVLKLISNCKSK